jgi:hypothetical protein
MSRRKAAQLSAGHDFSHVLSLNLSLRRNKNFSKSWPSFLAMPNYTFSINALIGHYLLTPRVDVSGPHSL